MAPDVASDARPDPSGRHPLRLVPNTFPRNLSPNPFQPRKPMKDHRRPTTLLSTLALAVLLSACNDGKDDKGSPGVGQSISGKNWTGSLYATDGSDRTAVKASISQDGEAVIITTDLPVNHIALKLTGTFKSTGKMLVTDPFDGELWSTFFGPAHGNYIKLADYETRPVPGNGIDDFYVLELSRNGGGRPPDVIPTAPGTTKDP